MKEAGYTPIGMPNAAGNISNIAGSWFIYDGAVMDCAESLRDGTFDWNNYKVMLDVYQNWYENGYLYADKATITGDDALERWAQNQAAFYLGVNTNTPINALVLNPDGDYLYIPTPASTPEGQMSAAVGEGNAFGIWKDTQNEAGAKAFLEFMSTVEPALALTERTGFIAYMDNTSELANSHYAQGLINAMQANFDNVAYENFFDREYLPSGVWSNLKTADEMLATDWSDDGIQQICDLLSECYTDIYEIAHEDD